MVVICSRAGTSSATLCDYELGRKSPRLETLERLLEATGHELLVDALPRPARTTREERRSRWLHAEIAARLREDPQAVLGKARSNLATMRRADDGTARRWFDQWDRLLEQPVDAVAGVLTGTSQAAADLRQNTPFAGVLTPRERWAAYRDFQRCAGTTSTT